MRFLVLLVECVCWCRKCISVLCCECMKLLNLVG